MIALKEWAIICKALEDGKQMLLLRKGGIMEYRKGFEVKHNEFLLYPTFEHQSIESIKAEYKEKIKEISEEHNISYYYNNNRKKIDKNDNNFNTASNNIIKLLAKVEDVIEISDKFTLSELRDYHIWSDEYVTMRMNYNPSKPMNVLLLRIYKIRKPLIVDINDKWAGCKSWIDIEIDREFQNSHKLKGQNTDYDNYESNSNKVEILKNEKTLIYPVINDDIFYESLNDIRKVIGK
ncbi:MAG TPA: DUF1802 family protein [Nitrososphaeraceae archaeon]|jgi:hypothetical protein|nr:DUF1802 family protein [Nitrososphaeraceae archaeon]